ncbi:MAG: hypothetical protein ACYCWB_15950 [Thiobacillus sp.]
MRTLNSLSMQALYGSDKGGSLSALAILAMAHVAGSPPPRYTVGGKGLALPAC